jgi:hypothetical protein
MIYIDCQRSGRRFTRNRGGCNEVTVSAANQKKTLHEKSLLRKTLLREE